MKIKKEKIPTNTRRTRPKTKGPTTNPNYKKHKDKCKKTQPMQTNLIYKHPPQPLATNQIQKNKRTNGRKGN